MRERYGSILFTVVCAFLYVLSMQAYAADGIDPSLPTCPTPFLFDSGKCVPDTAQVDKMESATCTAPTFKFTNKCEVAVAPTAQCNTVKNLHLEGSKCLYKETAVKSATGDYMGDTFHIKGVLPNKASFPFTTGTYIKVLSQERTDENGDRTLTVVEIDDPGYDWMRFGHYQPNGLGTTKTVQASTLIRSGASRSGWTYGVLTVPFKYYPRDKSFGTGVPIGPYAGRRWGTPGSAVTLAALAMIGSVKGEVRDADKKLLSTPTLTAYSLAAGLMWDISKADNIAPFKIGLFGGVDSVSTDDIVKFPNNRKPWIAFQVGFDFTDN